MGSLLERRVSAIQNQLVLLAPPNRPVPPAFDNAESDPLRREALLARLQQFRGSVYLADGAIGTLPEDGRHAVPEDLDSWHVLSLDPGGRVNACIWYREYPTAASIEDLRLRNCPLRLHRSWVDPLDRAVQGQLHAARIRQVPLAEIGGWAVAAEHRCTLNGVVLALSAFALGRLFGGALGLATATVRHASAGILRRLGGVPLESGGVELPNYYDPHYRCQMEILRFDSRHPSPRYDSVIDTLMAGLSEVLVLTPASVQRSALGSSVAA